MTSVMMVSTGIIPVPPITGGAVESHTFVLANALGRKGIDVHYISDIRKGAHLDRNITTHAVHGPARMFPAPFPLWILTHALGGLLSARTSYRTALRNIDVAHFHEEISALVYLKLKPRIPVVFTLHNPPPWIGSISSPAEAATRYLIAVMTAKHVIAKSHHFVALSSSVAAQYADWLGLDEHKITVVPHPVNTDFFKPNPDGERVAREKYAIEGPYILFVGRLDQRKGIPNLLEAVSKLPQKQATIIVGDGVEKERLMKRSRDLGISSSVRFLGAVPSSFLPGLYSGADCLAFPSLSEMSPLTVVEALSSGLPVIATDLPVLRGTIQNGVNGFRVPRTVESLRDAVSLVVNDSSLRKKMKVNARRIALETNAPDVVAEQMIKVYNSVAA